MITQPDPVRTGLEAVRSRPSLLVAEVCWRWAFGVAAAILLAATFLIVVHPVKVPDTDRTLLESGSPIQFANAVADIVMGIRSRLLRAFAIAGPGLVVLWTFAAALGRLFILPRMVGQARSVLRMPAASPSFPTLLVLSFGKAALVIALLGAYLGSAFVAALVAGDADGQDPWLFLLIFCALFTVMILVWSVLNWLLSIAPLFAVRDGRSAAASFADTVHLLTRRPHEMARITTVYAILRLIAMVLATVASVGLLVLGFLPKALIIIGIAAVTLVYFVIADLLFVSRLAAYGAIRQAEPVSAPLYRSAASR